MIVIYLTLSNFLNRYSYLSFSKVVMSFLAASRLIRAPIGSFFLRSIFYLPSLRFVYRELRSTSLFIQKLYCRRKDTPYPFLSLRNRQC